MPFVLSALALALSAPPAIAWEDDYAAGYAEAERTGKPVLLLFTASSGCVYCDKFAAGTLSDPRVVKAARRFVCIRVDTATAAGRRLAAAAGVAAWPNLAVHPKVGVPASAVYRWTATPADVLKALE